MLFFGRPGALSTTSLLAKQNACALRWLITIASSSQRHFLFCCTGLSFSIAGAHGTLKSGFLLRLVTTFNFLPHYFKRKKTPSRISKRGFNFKKDQFPITNFL
jgi:hypothetical protein